MRSMHKIKRAAVLVLVSLTAFGAQAASNNGNDWKRYPPIKKEQKQPVQVPEPGGFALLGIGLSAMAVRALLRRRKDE